LLTETGLIGSTGTIARLISFIGTLTIFFATLASVFFAFDSAGESESPE